MAVERSRIKMWKEYIEEDDLKVVGIREKGSVRIERGGNKSGKI